MSRIIFTRDGASVRDEGGGARTPDRNDPLALVRWFPARLEVDDGVTVRHVVKALEPWEPVVSALCESGLPRWLDIADRHPPHMALWRASRVVIGPVVVVSRGGPGNRGQATVAPRWRAMAAVRDDALEPLGDLEPSCWLDSPIEVRREIEILDIPASQTGRPSLPRPAGDGGATGLLAVPSLMATVLLGLIDDALAGGPP